MPETVYDFKTNKFDTTFNRFGSWVSEVYGSFVFVFLFMICTSKETEFSKDKVINTFITASAYVSARLMCGGNLVTCMTELTSPKVDVYVDKETEYEDIWERSSYRPIVESGF